MAIQVSGTTVIDDSRNLVNVIGLKTVNSTSLLGSGDIAAGASTTYGAVGTYVQALCNPNGVIQGTTYAGSLLTPGGMKADGNVFGNDGFGSFSVALTGAQGTLQLSGTWRAMGRNNNGAAIMNRLTLYVRIS
jgi:hypothetical protein